MTRVILNVLGLMLLAGCARLTPSWSASDGREEGAHVYRRACASCHGTDGRGGGPVAPSLRVPVPDLTSLAARHAGQFPRQWVIDIIVGRQNFPTHGTREMPVWNERFGSGPGHMASFYARRREELLADRLLTLQR